MTSSENSNSDNVQVQLSITVVQKTESKEHKEPARDKDLELPTESLQKMTSAENVQLEREAKKPEESAEIEPSLPAIVQKTQSKEREKPARVWNVELPTLAQRALIIQHWLTTGGIYERPGLGPNPPVARVPCQCHYPPADLDAAHTRKWVSKGYKSQSSREIAPVRNKRWCKCHYPPVELDDYHTSREDSMYRWVANKCKRY